MVGVIIWYIRGGRNGNFGWPLHIIVAANTMASDLSADYCFAKEQYESYHNLGKGR